jgi:hypothetical protein
MLNTARILLRSTALLRKGVASYKDDDGGGGEDISIMREIFFQYATTTGTFCIPESKNGSDYGRHGRSVYRTRVWDNEHYPVWTW